MLDTIQQTSFTVCGQRNDDDTYTFAGLVNVENVTEGNIVELNIKEPSGLFNKKTTSLLDEFRYFEMKHIQINEKDLSQLYFVISGKNIEEKVEFIDE